jgi:hypothetical protein
VVSSNTSEASLSISSDNPSKVMLSCDEKFLVFEVAFCAGDSEVGAMVMTTSLPCVGCTDDGLGDDGLELLGLNDDVYTMLLDLLGSNVVTRLKLG